MIRATWPKGMMGAVLAVLALHPNTAWACAACFGRSDSRLAQGMNMGILSLLIMVVMVLSSLAAFFFFLARRSAKVAASAAEGPTSEAASHSSI